MFTVLVFCALPLVQFLFSGMSWGIPDAALDVIHYDALHGINKSIAPSAHFCSWHYTDIVEFNSALEMLKRQWGHDPSLASPHVNTVSWKSRLTPKLARGFVAILSFQFFFKTLVRSSEECEQQIIDTRVMSRAKTVCKNSVNVNNLISLDSFWPLIREGLCLLMASNTVYQCLRLRHVDPGTPTDTESIIWA